MAEEQHGTVIDTTAFNNAMLRLARDAEQGAFVAALEKAAAFLIGKAIEHAPKDTGYMAGTGTWEPTGPAEVTLGFNTLYAYWMDQGNRRLPCKGYQSRIGPNEYLTGTLQRFQKTAMRIIADGIGRQIGAA